eukprot:GHVT01070988.1.p1 GENE.GHVT01070988.1~~GHVT01070988.1.p1  ORF type:complete len:108 (+),score=5.74 GHVT01070988.1:101-424(+)
MKNNSPNAEPNLNSNAVVRFERFFRQSGHYYFCSSHSDSLLPSCFGFFDPRPFRLISSLAPVMDPLVFHFCLSYLLDSPGRIRQGPAPSNFEIPPIQFLDENTIKLG